MNSRLRTPESEFSIPCYSRILLWAKLWKILIQNAMSWIMKKSFFNKNNPWKLCFYSWRKQEHRNSREESFIIYEIYSGGFLSGGFLAWGVFVRGVYVRGFLSWYRKTLRQGYTSVKTPSVFRVKIDSIRIFCPSDQGSEPHTWNWEVFAVFPGRMTSGEDF